VITGTLPDESGASFQEKSEYIFGPGQQDAKHHLHSQCAGSIYVLHVGILWVSKVVTPDDLEMLRSPEGQGRCSSYPQFWETPFELVADFHSLSFSCLKDNWFGCWAGGLNQTSNSRKLQQEPSELGSTYVVRWCTFPVELLSKTLQQRSDFNLGR
jgi:hypothetical protein